MSELVGTDTDYGCLRQGRLGTVVGINCAVPDEFVQQANLAVVWRQNSGTRHISTRK